MRQLLLSLALLAAIAAGAKDIKTLVVTTQPQMHCESCENTIKGNLRFEKGIKAIATDIPNQTVTISYDADKTTPQRIIDAFRKFGYEAQTLPEQPQTSNLKSQAQECPIKKQ